LSPVSLKPNTKRLRFNNVRGFQLFSSSFFYLLPYLQMAITSQKADFSARYNDVVQQANLAENSSVKGCMVIKPYGYAIRENIRDILDAMFKKTGHQNAYFPLFIPKSFLSKEASHVEGFAKECRVVTHYRLMNDPTGKGVVVDPASKLEEELIVRPTSETVIRDSFKNRIHSYRDLPLLINQRANVTRAEMRTRIFLRTSEFLRQEGHTAHATAAEAHEEAIKMFNVYLDFAKNFMAIYSYQGEKPAHDRFAGAVHTYAFEPMMQDFKALQAGTSHDLGQNFAKAFGVQFTNKENVLEYPYATSWGVSTRLMGGLIMAHSDDKGLVLPPALAPIHIVIVPIFKTSADLEAIKTYLAPALEQLKTSKLTVTSDFL
jgi:prolyl-tRNA synthetase